ncbi:MAG: MerR family transcriptional regulator, partial [Rhodobacteraceae bacterium]|nr:MerR family transcriptional regulator [Paracoccaceae bacterium]
MDKAPDAFRTISEVAAWLETPAHVLRFWESRFPQIRPVKRAGGRRYYRRDDMALLGGIKILLHDRGLSIRAVQKMIADEGAKAVAALAVLPDEMVADDDAVCAADGDVAAAVEADLPEAPGDTPAPGAAPAD